MEHSRYIDVHKPENRLHIMKDIFKHCCFLKTEMELERLFIKMEEKQLFPLLYQVGCITDERLRISLLNVVFFFSNLGYDQENDLTTETWGNIRQCFVDVIENDIEDSCNMDLAYVKFVCCTLRLKFDTHTYKFGFRIEMYDALLSMWRQIRRVILARKYTNNRNFQRKVDALFPDSQKLLNEQSARRKVPGKCVSLQDIKNYVYEVANLSESSQKHFLKKVSKRYNKKRKLEEDIKRSLNALREMKRLRNRSMIYKESNFFEILSMRLKENQEMEIFKTRLQELDSSAEI